MRCLGFVFEVFVEDFKSDVGANRMTHDDDKVIRLPGSSPRAFYSSFGEIIVGELDLILDDVRWTLICERVVVVIVKSRQAFAIDIDSKALLGTIEKRPKDLKERNIKID
jgi:hypothetical protein